MINHESDTLLAITSDNYLKKTK